MGRSGGRDRGAAGDYDVGGRRAPEADCGSGQEAGAGDGYRRSARSRAGSGCNACNRGGRIAHRIVGISIGQGASLSVRVGDHDVDRARRMGRSGGCDLGAAGDYDVSSSRAPEADCGSCQEAGAGDGYRRSARSRAGRGRDACNRGGRIAHRIVGIAIG